MKPSEIPSDSIAIIDSSVLFAMGGPSNNKYQALERFVRRQNISVKIPDQVAEELGESPDQYEYQRDRLRAAQDAGWLDRGEIDFTIPNVSAIVDKTRTRMAKLSASDVSEDDIEKTDTVLAGLAYQYAMTNQDVSVLVSDRLAQRAMTDVLKSTTVGEYIIVVEGRELLKNLASE